jgi:hypothetical protein
VAAGTLYDEEFGVQPDGRLFVGECNGGEHHVVEPRALTAK